MQQPQGAQNATPVPDITCATEFLRREVNLRVIQEAPGNKNSYTTQTCTHVVNEDVRRAMRT